MGHSASFSQTTKTFELEDTNSPVTPTTYFKRKPTDETDEKCGFINIPIPIDSRSRKVIRHEILQFVTFLQKSNHDNSPSPPNKDKDNAFLITPHIPLKSTHPSNQDGDGSSSRRSSDEEENTQSLHISLSKPLYVPTQSFESLCQKIKDIGPSVEPFDIAFSPQDVCVLFNDDHSRSFLVLKVTDPSSLSKLVRKIDEVLLSFKLERYHENPIFHMSIASVNRDLRPYVSGTHYSSDTNNESPSSPPTQTKPCISLTNYQMVYSFFESSKASETIDTSVKFTPDNS